MNLNDTQQRGRWLTFLLLGGVALILLVLDSSGNLDSALLFLENPLGAAVNWTAARTDAFADALAGPEDMQEAEQRIRELELQVQVLQRENEELREVQGELQLLQDLASRVYENPNFNRIGALVTGYDTSLATRTIVIDLGSLDGIVVGMPVEGARGLVGQVIRTHAHSALVLIITDASSAVPARLGQSRATGVVHGGGPGGALTMDWIDLEAAVAVGDLVTTSGLGAKFPEDMVVGRVVDVERREADLFQRAIVQPAVDFDGLEVVFVITDFTPAEMDVFSPPEGEELTP
jgi:rod shape-determining protein MreC